MTSAEISLLYSVLLIRRCDCTWLATSLFTLTTDVTSEIPVFDSHVVSKPWYSAGSCLL